MVIAKTIARRVRRTMTAPSAEALPDDMPSPAEVAAAVDVAGVSERNHFDTMMRAQAEALDQITKQVIVPEPRPRDGVQTAMSRLEARLSVTEKSLAALDQRLGERVKGLDGDTTALGERLHALRQKLEKFEEKQLTALAQLRLDVHNLRHSQSAEPPLPEVVVVAEDPASLSEAAPSPEIVVDDDRHEPSYLDAARKAAIEAAARAAAEPVQPATNWKKLWNSKRWLVVAIATVLVVWFDAYVFAHYQIAQGAVSEAVPAPQHRPLSARAQLIRGLRYWHGVGVAADSSRAKLWVERAALRGDPVAENLMGVLSQSDPAANIVVAIGWYETAARHGNVEAMTTLGKLYAGGWRQGADYAKAALWFEKAARAGDVDAAFDLAILCESGLGRPRDVADAYRWYAIAGGSGDKHAAARATVLAGKIDPSERDSLDRAILAFKPSPKDHTANDVPSLVNG